MTYRRTTRQRPLAERFWEKVEITEGCWLWLGATTTGRGGTYGLIWDSEAKRLRRAHRVAWELIVGPIPEGLTIDHVVDAGCVSTLCVRAPDHLEPVTIQENIRRGGNTKKVACPEGHPYDTVITRSSGATERRCSICHAKTERERLRRGKAKET